MNLKQYDGQRVRIYEKTGEYFEGICDCCGREYCAHEFGREEDCLQIANFLFFQGDIQTVKTIESYENPFGYLEELNLRDGIDSVYEELFCEEEEHVLRMLRCLGSYADRRDREFSLDRVALVRVLKELRDAGVSDACKEEIDAVLRQIETSV